MSIRTWHRKRMLASAILLASGATSVASAQESSYETPATPSTGAMATVYTEPLSDGVVVESDAAEMAIAPADIMHDMSEDQYVGPVDMPITSDAVTAYPVMEAAAPVKCNCCPGNSCTKKKKEAATANMKGAFKGLFYANNFGYLNDKCYDGPSFFGENLKGLANGKLDIGGEVRVRYHSENNHRGLGLTGRDDNFWLTRYRMYADFQLSEVFRVYGEYLYADSGGETFNNRPIEENRGEIQNLFLDTKLTDSATLRVGRQELLFGAQRLVSPLDWANTRRTFQGARLLWKQDDLSFDGFFVNPVVRNAANESKIDDANEDVKFFGGYASKTGTPLGTVDAYYLGLINDTAADFSYHTLGTRVAGKTEGGMLYEAEGGVQFGDNSPGFGSHSAGFLTGGIGRKLSITTKSGEWNPTVWAWYDWASGGDDIPAARGDDGFDHLFPLAHKYNGFMDLFGRRNLHDINFQFITPVLGKKVNLLLWYHHFFLDQATTPYGVTLAPFNPNVAAGDRELGQEIDVLFNINLNPRNNVLVGYSHFNSGQYFKSTPGVPTDADADFFYCQFQSRF